MPDRIKVYLAGPMTACKTLQKTAWRKALKPKLRDAGFQCLDPTDEKARPGALAVTADIEECDVIIANMWKESIGTVLGIVQAQRLGIPVILIDQHYMDNAVLESLVDKTVRGEEEAVNYLKNELAKTLRPNLTVKKKQKDEEFSFLKLQKSLKASCTLAGVDDAIFCTMLSRQVRRSILAKSADGIISSKDIKAIIFDDLSRLAIDDSKLSQADHIDVAKKAALVKDKWVEYELLYKTDKQTQASFEDSFLEELYSLSERIDYLSIEAWKLELEAEKYASLDARPRFEQDDLSKILSSRLQSLLKGRRGLCINKMGRPSFKSTFQRFGLSDLDFDRFFDEIHLDGKQSNLNVDLAKWVKKHGAVLYAWDSLRHLSDPSLKSAPNLFSGCVPSDTVRRMLSIKAA